jgi:hypothetical protein
VGNGAHWHPTAFSLRMCETAATLALPPMPPSAGFGVAIGAAGVRGAPPSACSDYAWNSGAFPPAPQTGLGWDIHPPRPAAAAAAASVAGASYSPQDATMASWAGGYVRPKAAAAVALWQRGAGAAGGLWGDPAGTAFQPSVRPLDLSAVASAAALTGSARFVAQQPAWEPSLPLTSRGGAADWPPSHSPKLLLHARLAAALLMGC